MLQNSVPTVLIIDDEPNILGTLRTALELEGYSTLVSGTAELGLEKLSSSEVDLVLLDVNLPGKSGIAGLQEMKETYPQLEVVMMSGASNIETAVEATRLGAYSFLEKPLSVEKLLLTLRNALERSNLVQENRELKTSLRGSLLGGADMAEVFEVIERVAPSNGRVLITGENGTGKEMVARALHEGSKRANGPFIKVNCAAIPKELIESELFGHEKGAFTGATQSRRGKFEQAHGGTLFLDEIGDMHPEAQAKVLRVLQENELERVGGGETIAVDVRVLAATNKELATEIQEGRFREDLFYRLNVVPIELPPLRARKSDVEMLAKHFLAAALEDNGYGALELSAGATQALYEYHWPGNVRELKNVIERLVILSGGAASIEEQDVRKTLGGRKSSAQLEGQTLKEKLASAERSIIVSALDEAEYNVSAAAKSLGLERSHLYKKIKSLGIELKRTS